MYEGNEDDTCSDGECRHQGLVAPVQDGVDEVVALLSRIELDRETGLARNGDHGSGIRLTQRPLVPAESRSSSCPVHHREGSVKKAVQVDVSQVPRFHTPPESETECNKKFSPAILDQFRITCSRKCR